MIIVQNDLREIWATLDLTLVIIKVVMLVTLKITHKTTPSSALLSPFQQ